MLCGHPTQNLEAGSIIDIEKVITEYAWRELKRDLRWYDCMKRQDMTFEVSWNFFEFDHKTTKFQLRTGACEDGYREKKQVELFRTDFTNDTNKDQVYKLRSQRQTKAATTVAIQKGFTLKGNTNFKLKIPPEIGHFGVSASADGYLRVCRPRGETFEDTFTWQVDSDVTVEPNHVTNARLLVTEDELVADFEVRTLLRMPTGEAPIIVRRKGSKDIYAVMMISDLKEVFSDIDCKIISKSKSDTSDCDNKRTFKYAIEFITQGILESVRWRNQKICLQSYPITHTPRSDNNTEVKAGTPVNTEDQNLYASSMLSKVLEHTITDSELYSTDKIARAKKGLRFNIIPSVIGDLEDEPYECHENVLSTLVRESMSITGSPSRLVPVTQQSEIGPSVFENKLIPSKAILSPRLDKPIRTSNPQIPFEFATSRSSDIKEPPRPSASAQSISRPMLAQDQAQANTSILFSQHDNKYKSQIENYFYRSGEITYRPYARDITQIKEEPDKEYLASMSKQSSLQSQETVDDTTESLDSGDSRRVSKVTSV